MVVGVTRGKAAVQLQCLAWQIAALVAGLPAEDRPGVGQRRLGSLTLAGTLEHLIKQARGESELIAFTGQGECLQLPERKHPDQVVVTVEGAHVFDGATALVTGAGGFIWDFRGELVTKAASGGGVRLDQV